VETNFVFDEVVRPSNRFKQSEFAASSIQFVRCKQGFALQSADTEIALCIEPFL